MGYVAHMVEKRNVNRVLEGNLKERDTLKDTDVDGRIILKWILQISNRRGCGLGLYGKGKELILGTCEEGS